MISSKILQATWNLETGQSIEFKLHSEYIWTQWQMYRQHAPFTEQDLISVVRHLKSQVKTGKRRPECLRFSTLIGDPTVFEEAMQFVRQHNTNPKNTPPTERQRVLAATGRTEAPKADTVKTPATELSKLGAMMKAWRENGGLG